MTSAARLAVDIGGTFTDLVLEHAGERTAAKVLTTPEAPERGVMTGVKLILGKARLAAADIALVIHGTTLATNAVIERKGARTALITTEGFRDVLALGNESRYDQYDLNIVLPEPLVPRHLRFTVRERVDNEGHVLLPLDEREVRGLAPLLRREQVESVAVGFIHGFVNPAHERRVAGILAELLADIPVSLASEVSPEMREWERFSTTVANAYVQPLMARYLQRLEHDLRGIGVAAPVFMMLSGGGVTTIETACRFPIRLLESGPAGGAIFAGTVARQCGLKSVLSFDMGGTTAKICLIDDYTPQSARSFEVARVGRFKKGSGLPLRIPVVEMVEIGAGGGSIAHLDTLGRIAVGPESAGADPGPACYGRGGTRPTVTDANLVLGRYDPQRFAAGSLTLHPCAAQQALAGYVGAPLRLETAMAALGVVEMVDENMANAARVHAIESGKTCEGRTLIAFGGGGPVHATRIAEKIGIDRVLIPSGAGVGSAIGFLRAPIGFEVVRSFYQRLSRLDVARLNGLLAEMAREAVEVVAKGSLGAETRETRLAYMRYVGQGHEIAVPLPARKLTENDVAAIRTAYDAEYTKFYNRPVPGSDIEVMSYAVTIATVSHAADEAPADPAPHRPTAARTRRVLDTTTGAVFDWSVYEREALEPGARFAGPAIVVEAETSTVIGAGWTCRITAEGSIDLRREAFDGQR